MSENHSKYIEKKTTKLQKNDYKEFQSLKKMTTQMNDREIPSA